MGDQMITSDRPLIYCADKAIGLTGKIVEGRFHGLKPAQEICRIGLPIGPVVFWRAELAARRYRADFAIAKKGYSGMATGFCFWLARGGKNALPWIEKLKARALLSLSPADNACWHGTRGRRFCLH